MFLAAELLGSKHIMGLVLTLIVIGIMFLISELVFKEKRKYVLYILLGSFYVLEIIKIAYIWIDNSNFPMNHLPFHLCSLPLYLMPLLIFVKNEKLLKFIKPAVVSGLMFGGVVALLYPVDILGDGTSFFPISDNFLPFISFIYHPLMIFAAIFVVFSGIYKIEFKKFYLGFPIIIGLMLMALLANNLFDQDFMLLTDGEQGPFYVLQDFGYLVYLFGMIFVGLLGMFIFHSIVYLFSKKNRNL